MSLSEQNTVWFLLEIPLNSLDEFFRLILVYLFVLRLEIVKYNNETRKRSWSDTTLTWCLVALKKTHPIHDQFCSEMSENRSVSNGHNIYYEQFKEPRNEDWASLKVTSWSTSGQNPNHRHLISPFLPPSSLPLVCLEQSHIIKVISQHVSPQEMQSIKKVEMPFSREK